MSFPDPRSARGDIVAIGGHLSPLTLIDAYRHGIFPWPTEGMPLPWFSPRRRAVLFFDRIHVSRSLARAVRQHGFTFTIDRAFRDVIEACAEVPRPGQDGTWIMPEVIAGYRALHELGFAHSVEVWDGQRLAGGIYGVDAGGAFAGESMFYREPNASKLALLELVRHLRSRGLEWLDIQVMTPHMEALGAVEIPRGKFLDLLAETQRRGLTLFGPVDG